MIALVIFFILLALILLWKGGVFNGTNQLLKNNNWSWPKIGIRNSNWKIPLLILVGIFAIYKAGLIPTSWLVTPGIWTTILVIVAMLILSHYVKTRYLLIIGTIIILLMMFKSEGCSLTASRSRTPIIPEMRIYKRDFPSKGDSTLVYEGPANVNRRINHRFVVYPDCGIKVSVYHEDWSETFTFIGCQKNKIYLPDWTVERPIHFRKK